MIKAAEVDAEICPYPRLAATRGSQHSQEIPIALIVNRIAAGIGASRGRISGRCNGPVRPRLAWRVRKIDPAMAAEFRVLFTGYVGDRVAGTVSFVADGDVRLVIDPGMVPETAAILGPLEELVDSPEDITDVIFSHHHPDHTLHAALFPNARFHDFWAIYRGDIWQSRPAEGFALSPSIHLMQTPGHTPQDITTLVASTSGAVAFTHLWWSANGPPEDPLAADSSALHRNRVRVLEVAGLIVPGHGAPFKPSAETPR
jgi:glyoxylase-like metal-dependent hydrolase (beta-lactamase superfamily II)